MSIGLRLSLAFTLSMVTLLGTLYWYYVTETKVNSNNQEILADVVSVSNEVNRKPTSRLLWLPLDVGDQISNGESIRTQSNSDVKLVFKDGTELHVEPDTFVVISKKEQRIGLNLLEGSLFANQSSSAGGQIVIESEDGNANLLAAGQSVISKDKNSKIQLSNVDQTNDQSLVIVSPKIGSTVYLKPNEKATFEFKAPERVEPKRIKLKLGSSRKNLSSVTELEIVNSNEFKVALKEGINFLQLFIEDDSGSILSQSPIMRFNARLLISPIIVFPRNNGEFKPDSSGEISIRVKEESLMKAQKTQFQVTGPNQFRLEGDLDTRGFAQVKLDPGGPYELTVWNFYEQSKIEKSESVRFQVLPIEKKEKPPFDLVAVGLPPKIETPLVPYALNIPWALSIRKDEIKAIQLEAIINDISVRSEKLDFKNSQGKIDLDQFGTYGVRVIGIDEQGKELAFSPVYSVELVQTPLIGPVTHQYQNGILAESNGRLVVHWDNLPEAKSYLMILKSNSQKDLEIKSFKNQAIFEDLLPGKYTGLIIPIDKWGRRGHESQGFQVQVPEISSIRAPTSKRVKIK